jgi:hypothetical protein
MEAIAASIVSACSAAATRLWAKRPASTVTPTQGSRAMATR